MAKKKGSRGKHPADRTAADLPPLPPEAVRALAEAEARRRAQVTAEPAAKEIGGRAGPDPTRYGDWEKKGIASDF